MKRIVVMAVLLLFVLPSLTGGVISFSADTMQAELAEGKERTRLTGNAYLSTEKLDIFADSIELYGDDLIFALCEGNIRVSNDEEGWQLVADSLFFNRRDDIIRIQGRAVMEDRKNEVVIKGGLIEIRNEENIIIIQIGVRILKDDLSCRSQMALYFREDDKLELTGMPFVFWKDDEYRATKIFVDLDKDEVTLEGDVKAEVSYEEEQTQEEGKVEGESGE